MTAHEFAVGVLQWMLIACVILGVAIWLERIFERPPKRNRYWMPHDIHDDKRRIERNGFKSRVGVK